MNIKVYSRSTIERLAAPEVPHIIISVCSSAAEPAVIAEGPHCLGVLRLAFDDLRRPMPDYPQFREFSLEDARQVWAFVEQHVGQAEELRVHCDKGRSRSPGIAAAISKVLTGHHGDLFRRCSPNMLVYNRMLKAHSETSSETSSRK